MINQIIIDDLSVSYGDNIALKQVTTCFNKGDLYALIGHNGAGKTTLINELLNINIKKQTRIRYVAPDLGKKANRKLKFKIAFSPEKPILFEELTIIEYINFVLKMYESYNEDSISKVNTLLNIFNLDKVRNKFIFSLSNGMKKKVCHIAALSLNSDFVFLDEPFAALDPVSIYELKNYILSHFGETTFILSTHQLDIIDNLAINPDKLQIKMLNKGEMVFSGTKNELFGIHNFKSIEEAYLFYHGGNLSTLSESMKEE